MQTLYGVRITERVTVSEVGPRAFAAFFDGVLIDTFVTGRGAVLGALDFLRERSAERVREEQSEAAEKKARIEREDTTFLYDLSDRIGCTFDDLERLLEIIARRAANVGN